MGIKLDVNKIVSGRKRLKLRPRRPIKVRTTGGGTGKGCCGRGLSGGNTLVPKK